MQTGGTTLGDVSALACAVDINPHKWGKYMVGSDHQIVSPGALREISPDLVVAMNSVYMNEIGDELRAAGVKAELVAL